MSRFKESMDEAEESTTKALTSSNISLSAIQTSLMSGVSNLKQKFSEEVSSLVHY